MFAKKIPHKLKTLNMKNSILLLAILFFSCKKDISKQIPTLDSHIKNIETIAGVVQYRYYNSEIAAYVTPIDDTKALVEFRTQTRGIFAEASLINGIYTLHSIDGRIIYFSFNVGDGYANDFKVFNPIHFERLFDNSAIQSTNDYVGCMKRSFDLCSGSWGCKILCGSTIIGITGCASGWSLLCAGR